MVPPVQLAHSSCQRNWAWGQSMQTGPTARPPDPVLSSAGRTPQILKHRNLLDERLAGGSLLVPLLFELSVRTLVILIGIRRLPDDYRPDLESSGQVL